MQISQPGTGGTEDNPQRYYRDDFRDLFAPLRAGRFSGATSLNRLLDRMESNGGRVK